MPKEIEFEEEAPRNKGGRPRKTEADLIFGDEIDAKEEQRLQEETSIHQMLQREDAATATIIVSRRTTPTQKYAHLTEIGINDYNREDLANQFGGGQYRCRVRRSDGAFGGTWYFEIDNSRRPEAESSSPGTPGGFDAVRLVETMAEKFGKKDGDNQLAQALMSKSDDMFKMMIMMQQENTKLIAGMMQAMASRPQPAPDSAMANMSTMLLKHSLDQSQTRMDDMISTIVKLKKLSDDKENDGDEEKGSFISDVMSAIPQIMQQVFKPQAAPAIPEQPTAPAQVKAPEANDNMSKVGIAMANVLQMAEAGADPAAVYDAYSPMLDDQDLDVLIKYLEDPKWFENLSKSLPAVIAHKEWFEELRDLILDEDEDEATEPEDNTGQPVVGVAKPKQLKKVKVKKG